MSETRRRTAALVLAAIMVAAAFAVAATAILDNEYMMIDNGAKEYA